HDSLRRLRPRVGKKKRPALEKCDHTLPNAESLRTPVTVIKYARTPPRGGALGTLREPIPEQESSPQQSSGLTRPSCLCRAAYAQSPPVGAALYRGRFQHGLSPLCGLQLPLLCGLSC